MGPLPLLHSLRGFNILRCMTALRRLLMLTLLFPVFALAVQAADLEGVITKARRFVGKERDLEAVRTLTYRGTIEIAGATTVSGTLELCLMKPDCQLSVRVLGDRRDTDGYDGNEGWVKTESVSKPALSTIDIISLKQLKRLRANVIENLWFYRGLEQFGGRVELRGETNFDGHEAVRVAFIHPGDFVFVRVFGKADGRLLATEGPEGELIREEGEMEVAGLRFPKRLRSTGKMADGAEVTVTIDFTEIKVNEPMTRAMFAVPVPGMR